VTLISLVQVHERGVLLLLYSDTAVLNLYYIEHLPRVEWKMAVTIHDYNSSLIIEAMSMG